ncbi:cell wall-binding repeat-containing protein [Halobacillus kuroshimensis]|uniref:cell wall-binding repeat-containing protein n=1 Tax=Halobacillus kuroshimensis TaxID=302481 RepID=UPI00041392EE|nr:cell wall-binding repeat-containing protein [Halobacillus kuroshimensis]
MKKWLGLAATALAAAGLFQASTVEAAQGPIEVEKVEAQNTYEEKEPNDGREDATQVPLNSYISGEFTDEDVDYYRVEVNGDTPVQFTFHLFEYVEEKTDMKFQGRLLTEQGEVLPPYSMNGNEYGYIESHLLDPGVYYMKVWDKADLGDGSTYYLGTGAELLNASAERIWGVDRYWTAANIAKYGDADRYPSENVVLATGEDFPDALAGAPLAEHLDAPILLTRDDKLPGITEQVMNSFDTEKVTILGGTGAVSTDVETYLENDLGMEVDRISGKNRYETAAAIADRLPKSDQAVVAYGRNFPDALSIAPIAAGKGMPILLTEQDELPEATEQSLKKYGESIAVGGTGVISSDVLADMPKAERISGKNRYLTSLAVVEHFNVVGVKASFATGSHFADALAGSVNDVDQPLLLTPKDELNEEIKAYVKEKEMFRFNIFGGTAAVEDSVEQELEALYE